MYTIIIYVTLCMSGTGDCHAQEPLSWTADIAILAVTADICTSLARELETSTGPTTVTAECHIIGPDERDRHVDL